MIFFAEVVETKKAFKPNQTDDFGNPLPLGSVEIRFGGEHSHFGNVRNDYARPAAWNRRIPLIGEHVVCMNAPISDVKNDLTKDTGYIYWNPINATDDLVLHMIPMSWTRGFSKMDPPKGKRKVDFHEPGYTFPKQPKKTHNIQPFEGDDIHEGRFGQSLRFGSTVQGDMSIYDKTPTWSGGANTDPITILRVKKPTGGVVNYLQTGNSRYTIEDLSSDESSIYITSTQKLPKLNVGFKKHPDAISAPSWAGAQVVIDSDRVILNAKKNKAFLIGNSGAVVTGQTVVFQSAKYKVDLDTLMDWLKAWFDLQFALVSAQAQYMTSAGPTATSTNMGSFSGHKVKFSQFLG